MPWNDILQQVLGLLREHVVKVVTGAVLMAVGWYIGKRRAQAHWKKQEFLDRLNISLNILESGTLKIRTLSEKRCEEVFLNSVAADTVQQLARKTTAKDPMLPIAEDDTWYYLNAILNDLSEQFAVGTMRHDMGGQTVSATYLIALTCENAGDMRTRKIRAMVTKKSLLTNLPTEEPKYERSSHTTRWQTMQFLAAEYARHPKRFLEVELCA
jgi:hypothetical protein